MVNKLEVITEILKSLRAATVCQWSSAKTGPMCSVKSWRFCITCQSTQWVAWWQVYSCQWVTDGWGGFLQVWRQQSQIVESKLVNVKWELLLLWKIRIVNYLWNLQIYLLLLDQEHCRQLTWSALSAIITLNVERWFFMTLICNSLNCVDMLFCL